MNLNYLFLILFTFSVTIKCISSSRILCVFPSPVKSHLIIDSAVANGLADRGHNVTVVTALPLNLKKNGNLEHILIDLPEYQQKFGNIIDSLSSASAIRMLMISFELFEFFVDYSVAVVEDEKMQKLFNEREYDLVIVGYLFNDIHFGIGGHFKCPNVIVWVNQPLPKINSLIGNPSEVSYVPLMFAQLTQPMNFLNRLKNSGVYIIETLRDHYIYYRANNYYDKVFPIEKNYPTFADITKNVSLILTASHFSDGIIRPTIPNLIEIGGVQVKGTPEALPQKFRKFLDNANNGAILFSLGSNTNSSNQDPDVMFKIFKVLSKLPQRIIWKWETDNVPGHSENILYEKWLPQDDILSHPNVRAFVAHGGLGGIAEARYHGVPIVGIPIYGDQPVNLANIELAGWAIAINYNEFTEEKFSNALENILHKPQYRDTVQKISKIYKDRPTSAMETAVFWIEYVLRYYGAAHLQSPAIHMNVFSYYSIDVGLVYFGTVYLIYIIFKFLIKFVIEFFRRKPKIKTN